MACGAPSGSAKPMTVCPERSGAGSAGVARTWSTMSDDLKSSGRGTSVAPCARYVSSVKPAARSRSRFDRDFEPRLHETRDGRRDDGDARLTRPRFFRNADSHRSECSRFHFFSQSTIALATAGVIVLSGSVAYSDTSPVSAGASR